MESGVAENGRRNQWWAERGSIRWIYREDDVAAAIIYVRDQQDNPRRFLK